MMKQKKMTAWVKTLLITIGLCVVVGGNSLGAEYTTICQGRYIIDSTRDSKLTETRGIVDLRMWKQANQIHVTWTGVSFSPWHSSKQVSVVPFHASTMEGSITNVIEGPDHFSFKINQDINVIGQQKDGRCSLQGSGMVWSFIDKKAIKIEWQSTSNKSILLPYNELR